MEQKIKLKPKQLASLTQIQQKKAQLQSMFQDLNTQETVILELVLEGAGVDGDISDVKLEQDSLVFQVKNQAGTQMEAVSKKSSKTKMLKST